MGNCACFQKSAKTDSHEITLEQSQTDPKTVYENIIKIQSTFRGYLARKTYHDERLANYNQQVLHNLKQFASAHLKIRLQSLPPYPYDLTTDDEDPLFENRLFKPISHIAPDQGVYIGEWYTYFTCLLSLFSNKLLTAYILLFCICIYLQLYFYTFRVDDCRHGRGIQIWPDGSIYEGYWRDNKANIIGRLLRSDGDLYDGEWLNGKAHGTGKYQHSQGSQYVGRWEDDKQNGYGRESYNIYLH